MKIGIDIYGGDFAPQATVNGSIAAYKELPQNIKLVLIGDQEIIKEICVKNKFDYSVFEIIHTHEFIDMNEHPLKAFQQKPNSSISIGYQMLNNGELEGFASAGSTGAMLIGAMYTIKVIQGIIRPVLSSIIPSPSDKTLLLDVGLNPDARPDVLFQYALLGSLYSQHVFNLPKPRVAILNIGSEEEKGNLVTKALYSILKEYPFLNFVGNIEGNELFHSDNADVIICDGFVGNIVLKEAESFYALIKKLKIQHDYFDKFNYENYGGSPILGVNKVAVIGHGISNEKAIKNMIIQTISMIKSNLINKIIEAINLYND